MFGLAIHLSIGVFTALAILFVEALAMCLDAEPPLKFFKISFGIMWFYFGFSALIWLSLQWRVS